MHSTAPVKGGLNETFDIWGWTLEEQVVDGGVCGGWGEGSGSTTVCGYTHTTYMHNGQVAVGQATRLYQLDVQVHEGLHGGEEATIEQTRVHAVAVLRVVGCGACIHQHHIPLKRVDQEHSREED